MSHDRRLGCLIGAAVIDDGISPHDLHDETWIGPTVDGRVKVVEHGAQFMLLVEKRNIFDSLVQDRFHVNHPCIMATGNGYPGRWFREVLRELHDQLRLPFYVLADNDPAGYALFFLIARGGARCQGAGNPALAIPHTRFLGLRAADFRQMGLSASVGIELSETERDLLARLKSAPWLRSDEIWQRELKLMSRNGFKVEMEALCSVGESFLAEEYLPRRLAAGEHLLLSNSSLGESK
jgi:DNA topoisomerase VI subunit A